MNYDSANDTLAVLISASSSWAEDGNLIKVALLEISLPSRGGKPLGTDFQQRFQPADATVRFTIPAGNGASALAILAYVDAHNDSIVVSISPPSDGITARLTRLRPNWKFHVPGEEPCAVFNRSADVVAANGRLVYHRNSQPFADTYMARSFKVLNLDPNIAGFVDPLANRSTGVYLAQIPNGGETQATTFTATVLTAQTNTAEEFEAAIAQVSLAFGSVLRTQTQLPSPAHTAWWAAKWSSHNIEVAPATHNAAAAADTKTITKLYTLQRFIELSQARSPYPIKFNGMLYIASRVDADNNIWGGLNWWQNLRHPYYNMLTSGDLDELKTLFIAFAKTIPVARMRTRAYFGFDGLWWPEYTLVHHGTPHLGGIKLYGYRGGPGCTPEFPGEPTWHSDDTWNGYNRQGSLDLSLMILDHAAYTGELDPDLLAIPFGVVQFYWNLWGNTTASDSSDGEMVFYPTQALETWQCPGWPVNASDCPTNDMPTVAGLHTVLEKLLQLPQSATTDQQRAVWTKMSSRLPALPTIGNKFAPCSTCVRGGTGPGSHRMSNGENAELYAVHPYRRATVARGDADALAKGRASFLNPSASRQDVGWNQNVMDAALLGNASAATQLLVQRARTRPAPGYRFPAFAPREQDAAPSADHFAIFQNALQYMLIQQVDDENQSVLLLPAWPCGWDVNFTLSAPQKTTITGRLVSGKLEYSVTPSSRASAVRAASCQQVDPPPAPVHCNMTAWRQFCPPMPNNSSACMACCSTHSSALWKLNCIGPDCWPDYCSGKPAPGCK